MFSIFKMEAFVKVIEKDLRAQDKTNDTLGRYMRFPLKYQSKIGYDTLIQKIILKELIKKMSTTITDLDIEKK